MERRTSEHIKTFSKIKKANLALQYYSYIDPKYISEAESHISNYFNLLNCNINYNKSKEIVAINKKFLLKEIKQQYNAIYKMYCGNIADMVSQIRELENKLVISEQNNKLIETENKLMESEKNLIISEKNNKILELTKQSEIDKLNYERQLLEQKIKYMELQNKQNVRNNKSRKRQK